MLLNRLPCLHFKQRWLHAGAGTPVLPRPVLPKAAPSAVAAPPSKTVSARKKNTAAPDTTVKLVEEYDADQIQVLEGLEPVRKRPGMYIGSTGQRGLHHLIYEVLDNAIDEVQGGHARSIDVDMDLQSGWVTITDDGRGIPVNTHPRTGKSALETVLTVLHAGGKFGGDSSGYKVSGGLHGVGISVVNALAESLHVKVWRGGSEYSQQYARGQPITPLHETRLPAVLAARRGTEIRFLYDSTIFAKSAVFDPDTISSRLRELAFLNNTAHIRFRAHRAGVVEPGSSKTSSRAAAGEEASADKGKPKAGKGSAAAAAAAADVGALLANGSSAGHNGATAGAAALEAGGWQVFHYEGGLREYVLWLNQGKEMLHDPIYFQKCVEGVTVEVALQWCADVFSDTLIGFANSIRTVDGGTHMEGLKAALTRTINGLVKKNKVLKEGEPSLSGEHIREGLGGIVSVKVQNPEFEGQTKTRLGNPEVRKIVETCVYEATTEWLETHPSALQSVVAKALQAARAADAAKKARELVRRKNVLTRSMLPGKLADCTSSNRSETEIFLVEGDSAGGSAKQARDRFTQAILPLRGKILNVERKDDSSIFKNQEISNLIVALGLGTKGEGLSGLRYNRVIVLTDADVDGAHIRTLLLTFMFRYRRELFEAGHVFAAVPPLYRVEMGKKQQWCYSDAELQQLTKGMLPSAYNVQRFKGLGEMMPEQLWQTTLNPATRTLRRLTIEDAAAASHMFTLLMGDKVAPRRELIEAHGSKFTLADLDV